MIKTVAPVMGEDERDAAVVVLRAVLGRRILVEHDADKVGGAIEAMLTAPAGPTARTPPGEVALGPFARRSETSRMAAIRNYPRSGTQRMKVLARVAQMGDAGATRDELIVWLGMPPNVCTPRVKELVQGLWLTPKVDGTGKAVTRKTRAGSEAEVLVLTSQARVEMRRRGGKLVTA